LPKKNTAELAGERALGVAAGSAGLGCGGLDAGEKVVLPRICSKPTKE